MGWVIQLSLHGNMIKQKTCKFCVNNKKTQMSLKISQNNLGQSRNDLDDPVFLHELGLIHCQVDVLFDWYRWPGAKLWPGPWFNIKMSSYQYRKSHCGDKTVVRSSYLRNGVSYTGKITSLYWIGAQVISNHHTDLKLITGYHCDPLVSLLLMGSFSHDDNSSIFQAQLSWPFSPQGI